jgi:hypothetical protein
MITNSVSVFGLDALTKSGGKLMVGAPLDGKSGWYAVSSVLNITGRPMDICWELSNFLQGYDDSLVSANPSLLFNSRIFKINNIPCAGGICPCSSLRRLLVQRNFCYLEIITIQTGDNFLLPKGYNVNVQTIKFCGSIDIDSCLQVAGGKPDLLVTNSATFPVYAIIVIVLIGALFLFAAVYLWFRRFGYLVLGEPETDQKLRAVGDFVLSFQKKTPSGLALASSQHMESGQLFSDLL